MSKADDVFMKQFGGICVLLFLFTLVVFFIARSIGAEAFEQAQNGPKAVAARLAQVGEARVGDPAQIVAAAADTANASSAAAAPETAAAATTATAAAGATQVAAAGQSGEEVYKSACFACHDTGAANAPKLDDAEAWGKRAEAGMDALNNNAINGKNSMPARGGNSALSDDEVKAAVQYILDKAGVEVSG